MGTPYLGEIKLLAFNFAPRGWALCNGQLLPINQNQALFSLLGTMYGGDGRVTFALPNLQGRVPMHRGVQFTQGASFGEFAHTVNLQELPTHVHVPVGSSAAATLGTLANNDAPGVSNKDAYVPSAQALTGLSTTATGGSQPHENRMPSLVLNFCIALVGIFPSRN